MRRCPKIVFWLTVASLVAVGASLPSFVAAEKQKPTRLALKSGYLADQGLLDRKFCSIQLLVEIEADGTGKGYLWDDPNIQPDQKGFFYDPARLGELPEGGKTCLDGPQYEVRLTQVPPQERTPKGSRLFRVAGLEVAELKVSGEVYLAEHQRDGSKVYRLFRTQDSRGGKRVVESILLEPKEFANR